MVRIFSKAANHAKKATLKGALFCQILQGKRGDIMGNKNLIVRSNIKKPTLGRNPTEFIQAAPSHSNGIKQSEE
jgi:predicted oxidoreductase